MPREHPAGRHVSHTSGLSYGYEEVIVRMVMGLVAAMCPGGFAALGGGFKRAACLVVGRQPQMD
jgi:hypothetical protein